MTEYEKGLLKGLFYGLHAGNPNTTIGAVKVDKILEKEGSFFVKSKQNHSGSTHQKLENLVKEFFLIQDHGRGFKLKKEQNHLMKEWEQAIENFSQAFDNWKKDMPFPVQVHRSSDLETQRALEDLPETKEHQLLAEDKTEELKRLFREMITACGGCPT